jgi:hypothetical protein|tara:strand:- start:138 stop:1037 length:900 start_codon:yes stop_codon:yes gene_type:complete
MKTYLPYIVTLIVISLFLVSTIDSENKIENLEVDVENKTLYIDSLINKLHIVDSTYKQILDSLPIGPPLDTININNGYGVRKHPIHGGYQMHSGVDLIDTWHDTVYATGSGIVRYAGWNFGYGRCIEIEHAYGFTSSYAHLNKIFVKKGSNVKDGEPIGCMGKTGDATGQHLHYEISHDGKAIDPIPYINCIPINVEATMYHPVESQCDANPLETADGSIIDPYNVSSWNWIAVSQDMLKKNGGIFEYGDQVYITGTHKDGLYTIRDCMNRRFTYKIDFLENIGTEQYRYDDIELYALN